ncbi:MAG: pentapeptide repeat-containing protein [Crinalium sp.]
MLNLSASTNKFSNITYISQKISIRAVITGMVLICSSIEMCAIAQTTLPPLLVAEAPDSANNNTHNVDDQINSQPLPSLPSTSKTPELNRLLSTGECFGCNLVGVDLTGVHLVGVDLRNANLQGAIFVNANLEGADLAGANLQAANFTAAFVSGTDFSNANLTKVNFTQAKLIDSEVAGAVLQDITLTDAEVFNTAISIGGEDSE